MNNVVQPIEWTPAGVVMLDQRRLPAEVVRHTYTDYQDVAAAIRDMVIRGAPAIGVAAAMGIALGVQRSKAASVPELRAEFPVICDAMAPNPSHRRRPLLGHQSPEAPLRGTRRSFRPARHSPGDGHRGSPHPRRKARH